MTASSLDDCDFVTGRLQVGPLHAVARRAGLDLAGAIAELLTDRTTVALPESWQGNLTLDRAKAWIEERSLVLIPGNGVWSEQAVPSLHPTVIPNARVPMRLISKLATGLRVHCTMRMADHVRVYFPTETMTFGSNPV